MKKRSSAGLVCCFNSQRDEGQARSPWKVGVTTDVLLACLLLLHSFQASTQARASAWTWNWTGTGTHTCINKGKQKHAGNDLRHWGGLEQALANIDLPD